MHFPPILRWEFPHFALGKRKQVFVLPFQAKIKPLSPKVQNDTSGLGCAAYDGLIQIT